MLMWSVGARIHPRVRIGRSREASQESRAFHVASAVLRVRSNPGSLITYCFAGP